MRRLRDRLSEEPVELTFETDERVVSVPGYVFIDDGELTSSAHLVESGVRNFETVPVVCGRRVYALDQTENATVDRACQSCLNDVAARQLEARNSARR